MFDRLFCIILCMQTSILTCVRQTVLYYIVHADIHTYMCSTDYFLLYCACRHPYLHVFDRLLFLYYIVHADIHTYMCSTDCFLLYCACRHPYLHVFDRLFCIILCMQTSILTCVRQTIFFIIVCMQTSILTCVRQTVFYHIVHADIHTYMCSTDCFFYCIVHADIHTYMCSTDCFVLYCSCRHPYLHVFDRLFSIILCMQTSILTCVRQTVLYYIVHADIHTYMCSTDCFLLYCACRHPYLHVFDRLCSIILCMQTSILTCVRQTVLYYIVHADIHTYMCSTDYFLLYCACRHPYLHVFDRLLFLYYIVHADIHTYMCSTDCFLLYCACRHPYLHVFDRLFCIILCMQTSILTCVRQTIFFIIVCMQTSILTCVRQTVFYYIVHANIHTYMCSTDCFLSYCACRHPYLHVFDRLFSIILCMQTSILTCVRQTVLYYIVHADIHTYMCSTDCFLLYCACRHPYLHVFDRLFFYYSVHADIHTYMCSTDCFLLYCACRHPYLHVFDRLCSIILCMQTSILTCVRQTVLYYIVHADIHTYMCSTDCVLLYCVCRHPYLHVFDRLLFLYYIVHADIHTYMCSTDCFLLYCACRHPYLHVFDRLFCIILCMQTSILTCVRQTIFFIIVCMQTSILTCVRQTVFYYIVHANIHTYMCSTDCFLSYCACRHPYLHVFDRLFSIILCMQTSILTCVRQTVLYYIVHADIHTYMCSTDCFLLYCACRHPYLHVFDRLFFYYSVHADIHTYMCSTDCFLLYCACRHPYLHVFDRLCSIILCMQTSILTCVRQTVLYYIVHADIHTYMCSTDCVLLYCACRHPYLHVFDRLFCIILCMQTSILTCVRQTVLYCIVHADIHTYMCSTDCFVLYCACRHPYLHVFDRLCSIILCMQTSILTCVRQTVLYYIVHADIHTYMCSTDCFLLYCACRHPYLHVFDRLFSIILCMQTSILTCVRQTIFYYILHADIHTYMCSTDYFIYIILCMQTSILTCVRQTVFIVLCMQKSILTCVRQTVFYCIVHADIHTYMCSTDYFLLYCACRHPYLHVFDRLFSIILCMQTSILICVRQTVFYYIVHADIHTYMCSTDNFLLYCACRHPYLHVFDRQFSIILCMQTSILTCVRQTIFYYIVHADIHTYMCSTDYFLLYSACRHPYTYVRKTVFYYIVHADIHSYIRAYAHTL